LRVVQNPAPYADRVMVMPNVSKTHIPAWLNETDELSFPALR
jgi:hypothetical protein